MLNQVADGVWVRQSEWVWTNSIVVRGEDGLILVDPGIDGSDLNQLADDVDRLGIPVVAGFSTHPHWDHLLWHARFGDVPRYATPAGAQAASEARERAQRMAAESASGIPLELIGLVTPLPADGGPVPGEIIEAARLDGASERQIEQIETAVAGLERQLLAWHKTNPVSQRLASIPGIGPTIATAIATTVADPKVFRSGREFAAWMGLVPRQNSTGGKTRLGGITKRGNRYLRRLLINGASANLLRSKATKADPWVIGLRRRRPPLVVAVALANKTARIAWAVMLREKEYQPRAVAA
jgi:hypothetical protein